MSKDPTNLGVDLHIAQLLGEGTTWHRIRPHGHLSLTERMNLVAEKGPQEVRAVTVE
jgi:hypothetical protein